ncbi:MAG: NAD(+) synthase [Bacteroidales bacterium]|nr:NAD(+) synthase [Bacteroidales bacterium]MBR5862131.1 NAD(+) synthase [Bacteroidales bacterium]
MKNYGFIRTAAAVPAVRVADVAYNTAEICRLSQEAFDKGASLTVFPELSLTGHSCGDLFRQSKLIKAVETAVKSIAEFTRGKAGAIVVGAPVPYRNRLYNTAVIMNNGFVKGIVPKTVINAEQSRWFASGNDFLYEGTNEEITYADQLCTISPNMLFEIGDCTFAVEIGEDLWAPVPQSSHHVLQGAHIIANLSADRETLARNEYRTNLLKQHSAKTISGYVYASAGFGESTQDNVYAGAASVWENGFMLAENTRFQTESSLITADIDIERIENLRRESGVFSNVAPTAGCYWKASLDAAADTDFCKKLDRYVDPHPFIPSDDASHRYKEILDIQVAGLVKRLSHINCQTAVIGISGGLDSTLALLVTALAFEKLGWDSSRIVTVTMPGFGTTVRTKNNATDLMEALGTTSREICIADACIQHFKDIEHDSSVHNATYENSQARERTQILMDIANQTNGIVIGTGDLSELALGWATYNGDHMSMYGVNGGVPKTLVRNLVKWAAENRFENVKGILLDIVDTPISPELLPANDNGEIQQVTEDLVGPYELHDFFIYNYIRNGYSTEKIFFLAQKAFANVYDDETILKWLKTFIRRFFSQQFKRSCLPDGPAIGSVSLSPRGAWEMPSDAWSTTFTPEI